VRKGFIWLVAVSLSILIVIFAASVVMAQSVTITKWQDLQPYIAAQTNKLNAHTDEIAALRAELDAEKAKVAVLTEDIGKIITRFDISLRMYVILACNTNRQIEAAGWGAVLVGIRPLPVTGLECPPLDANFYVPAYLSPSGPPVPPVN
jgi:hypothetical protein